MISWKAGLHVYGRHWMRMMETGFTWCAEQADVDKILRRPDDLSFMLIVVYCFILLPFSAISALIFTALLPVTSLLALIKPLFDFFSRQAPPEEQMNQFNAKYDALDDESRFELFRNIIAYEPHAQSNSSQALINLMRQVDEDYSNALNRGRVLEETRLTQKRKETNTALAQKELPSLPVSNNYKIVIEPSGLLTLEDKVALLKYVIENNKHCSQQCIDRYGYLVKEYVSNERNEGKKLQQIIFNSIFAEKKKPLETNNPLNANITPLINDLIVSQK
jgi:hypothetical protein